MNHRSINKNPDLQLSQERLTKAIVDQEKYEQEKSEWAKKISDWNERYSQQKTKKEQELERQ